MQYLEQKCELIEAEGLHKIELAARTCYKSEGLMGCTLGDDYDCKLPDCVETCKFNSAYQMFGKLLEKEHLAMIEHDQFLVKLSIDTSVENDHEIDYLAQLLNSIASSRFMSFTAIAANEHAIETILIGGNIRAWIEMLGTLSIGYVQHLGWFAREVIQMLSKKFPNLDLYLDGVFKNLVTMSSSSKRPVNFLAEEDTADNYRVSHPEVYNQYKFITVRFQTNRGVANELVRHRPNMSYGQESTRYVKYRDMMVISNVAYGPWQPEVDELMKKIEELYSMMVIGTDDKPKLQAQAARGILPIDLKADICVTAPMFQWMHILDLRYYGITGPPHPQMKEMMKLFLDTVTPHYPELVKGTGWKNL